MLSILVTGAAAWADPSMKNPPSSTEPCQDYCKRTESCHEHCRREEKKQIQEPSSSPGEPGMASTAEASEVTRGYLKDEKVGIKPQLGVLAYTDAAGSQTSRAAYGFTVDANLAKMMDSSWNKIYLGASTGLLYSHLGAPSSNLFGAQPTNNPGTAGANLFLIPANIKVAYHLTDQLRVGVHGGGNIVYRSVASAAYFGDSSNQSGSVWRAFPNAGGDFELGLGEHTALMFRPDWTFTPGTDFFTGTLALNIPLS